jgi:hypothetical protein
LDYGNLLEHCLFCRAHPEPGKDASHEIVACGAVGVALFRYKHVEFLVAWGGITEPWCSVHLFKNIANGSRCKRLAATANLQKDFTAGELMEGMHLIQARLWDQDLTSMFKKTPLLTSQAFTITIKNMFESTAVLDTSDILTITGSWKSAV